MTREEKLAILIYDSVWIEEAESVFVEKVKSAIKSFIDNENPWHKASEELPNYATRVEIVHQIGNDMDIHIGVLLPLPDKQIWKIDDGRCLNENEVTYWRQLPELPKED